MERLYPAEPARSRAELVRLTAMSRSVEPKVEPAAPAPSPVPAETDESLFPGTRYRILRELGRGAMGVVFEAHHVDLGRVVALKVLPRERCKSPELETRFRREARAIARLKHPNLVQLHDFGVSTDGQPYYAMELLEGETLERYLDRERGMDWREAARIGIETCNALEAAHEAGLVHRDIKPGNLFLMRDGRVKLLDFGIVQVSPEIENAGDSEALRLVGTAEYMAPEQAAGEAVDARADLYALGAVLYELVTGRQPHVAPTTIALIDKKLRAEPEAPRERAPGRGIPRALDRVLMKSLARFSAHRYENAAAMRAALEAALDAPTRTRALRRRAAVAALLMSAVGLGAYGIHSARKPDVRARAVAMMTPALSKFGVVVQSPGADAQGASASAEDPPIAVLYDVPKTGAPAENVAGPAEDSEDTTAPSGTDNAEEPSPSAKPSKDPSEDANGSIDSELAVAEAYTKRGQHLFALTTYRKLGKLHGNDARVLRGWSDAAVKTKGWGEALRVAITWASRDSSPEAQLYLARIQHAAGQRYGAIATLTRLVAQHPELHEAADMLDRYGEKKVASR
jgi:serine/threonine-protein kinase